MTPADVAKVLAKASAFDQRTIGQADVAAWHEVLAEVDLADGLAAVTRHYAEHTDRLMPAHVRRLAVVIDRERRAKAREQREDDARLALEADPTRRDRSADVRALIARLRDSLPIGRPDKLRRPEWVEADRRRATTPVPNPHYDPAALLEPATPGRSNP